MEWRAATSLFRLDERIALVTGGSRGLGKALAQALAAFGANIVLIARDADCLAQAADELRSQGTGVWTYAFDLGDTTSIPDRYASILAETGGVDILVNNAAVVHRAPAEQFPLDEWDRMLATGLTGPLALAQAFARERITSRRPGKIINVGSLFCHGARPEMAGYSAMKLGLHGLTRALALDWARHNIQVNTLAPGYFHTDMTRPLAEDAKMNDWILANTPAGRWGKPTDLAGAAVFLASRASDFVTGQVLYVDGGWSAGL